MKKKAIITGAASGIGKATAERFALEDFDLLLLDIQTEKLQQVLQNINPGDHHIVPGSYADKKTISAAEKLIHEKWNSVDVLVNCAGLFRKSDAVNLPLQQWREVFDIMIDGCVLTSQLAVKFMKNSGRIVHITSIHGKRAEQFASSYSTAKAAIEQMCRSLAVELASRNILVNAIAPGFVDTPMAVVNGENELESEWFRKNYMEGHHLPLRRAARPDEIAGVAKFLCSDDASYITGQVITVDGGLTITF